MATNPLLSIDPGTQQSAYCSVDIATRRPVEFGILVNDDLLDLLYRDDCAPDSAYVEMVASYGMAVGADVFETCVWIGRFSEALRRRGADVSLVKRMPVKVHLCHSSRATDANIRQALVDRFAPGVPNHGKGSKADPGWFYGFAADAWAAYALGVYAADTIPGNELAPF